MWYNGTVTAMRKLRIAYNNSLRRLLGIPKYNSASEMFVQLNIKGSFHLKSPKKSANLNGSDPDFDESAYIWSL